MDSPRGPAFQPQGRWSDPDGWAAAARPCTRRDCDQRGECDGRETAIAGGAARSLGAAARALWARDAADAPARVRRWPRAVEPRAAQAAARARDSCQGVRIRGPSAVIATVNSKCAASEPSWE